MSSSRYRQRRRRWRRRNPVYRDTKSDQRSKRATALMFLVFAVALVGLFVAIMGIGKSPQEKEGEATLERVEKKVEALRKTRKAYQPAPRD